jgi:hypothetical protein
MVHRLELLLFFGAAVYEFASFVDEVVVHHSVVFEGVGCGILVEECFDLLAFA